MGEVILYEILGADMVRMKAEQSGFMDRWVSIVEAVSVFTAPLIEGLSDGFKTRETVDKAIQTFQSLVASTKQANVTIYSEFSKDVQSSN